MRVKLTQPVVDKEPFVKQGQKFLRDEELRGFAVRVGKTKKTYLVEGRTNGKVRRVVIGNTQHMMISDARKRAKVELAAFSQGRDTNLERALEKKASKTLSEAFDSYLAARAGRLAEKTVYDYRLGIDRFFGDWKGAPLRSITPNAFLERFDEVTSKNGKASATTATRLLSAIWTHARETSRDPLGEYTMPETPTSIIKGTNKQHKQVRRKTYIKRPRDFFKALHKVQSFDFRVFFELAYRTGARRSELANLRWDDVNFADRTVLFRNTKNGTDHTLPMSLQTMSLLRLVKTLQVDGGYIWGPRPFGDPRRSLGKLEIHYGEHVMAHDMRRSFVNLCADCGIPRETVKVLVNHISEDVTDGYATRDIGPRHHLAIQRVSDLIDWKVFPTIRSDWII